MDKEREREREREREIRINLENKTDKNPDKTNTKWDFKSESFVYFLFGFFLDA